MKKDILRIPIDDCHTWISKINTLPITTAIRIFMDKNFQDILETTQLAKDMDTLYLQRRPTRIQHAWDKLKYKKIDYNPNL